MTLGLAIAGYRLRLSPVSDVIPVNWPLPSYDPFLEDLVGPSDLEFTIHVGDRLPTPAQGALVFDSCHGLWRLFEGASGLVFESLDTKTRVPRVHARISEDFSRIEVSLLARCHDGRNAWMPMHVLNPLAEVCLLTRLGREGGFLLHACGALLGGEGWVFTGASGTGKSTMADLLAGRRALVLSDERVIMKKHEAGFAVYGTPWVGAGRHARNRSGRLTRLFCIQHGRARHALAPMTPGAASQWVLQQTFLPHWDRAALQGTLGAIGDLVERVECAGFAFLRDPSVVDFLRSHGPLHKAGAA